MKKILLCLDTDPQPSVFDAVVAIDSGVDHLLRHGGVEAADVEGLVHGAMFTRGAADLRNTAVFVGGSDVPAAEELFRRARDCFFGPNRVSLLFDPNGANTTAAAAVVSAGRHLDLAEGLTAAVVGAGPVGRRVAGLLASAGVAIRLVSQTQSHAAEAGRMVADAHPGARIEPFGPGDSGLAAALAGAELLVAAGPAGREVVPGAARAAAPSLRVVIDLNAAPPAGVGGVGFTDRGAERDGQIHYGPIGVGGLKMRIHKAALQRLFESTDAVLDAAGVYELARQIASPG